jgi:hypothetical protein
LKREQQLFGQRTNVQSDLPAESDAAASYQQLRDAVILSRTTALFLRAVFLPVCAYERSHSRERYML